MQPQKIRVDRKPRQRCRFWENAWAYQQIFGYFGRYLPTTSILLVVRIVYIILALLFALFAYFQYNDPDSLGWIAMYAAVAILFGLMATGRYFRWVTIGLATVLVLGLLFFAPGFWNFLTNDDGISFAQGMSNDYPYIEEAREFGGLLIALGAVILLLLQGRRLRRR